MPVLLAALAGFAALGHAAPRPPEEPRIDRSVVRIFTVFRKPDFYQPWQMAPQDSASGSGCVIAGPGPGPGGNRILTNAHVVSDQVFVQVRRAGPRITRPARRERRTAARQRRPSFRRLPPLTPRLYLSWTSRRLP